MAMGGVSDGGRCMRRETLQAAIGGVCGGISGDGGVSGGASGVGPHICHDALYTEISSVSGVCVGI